MAKTKAYSQVFRVIWLSLLGLLACHMAALAVDYIADLPEVPDQSVVTASGFISSLVISPSETDPKWANFDITDRTGKVHVYWLFGRKGMPFWLQADACVQVQGTYWVAHPKHPNEPQIEAKAVVLATSCQGGSSLPSSPSSYAIIPWGAAGEVAGSCYELKLSEKNLLIDCGSFMNSDDKDASPSTSHHDTDPFPFSTSSIGAVLITHAHDDHVGRLQYLVEAGFDGKIYATKPTADIIRVKLAHTIEHGQVPSHLKYQVKLTILHNLVEVPYDFPVNVLSEVSARFVDAGHVPGSASIVLSVQQDGID